MERCCLVTCAKVSYQAASEDIELLTGIQVGHSTLHRLVQRVDLPLPQSPHVVSELSADGGKVRLRTSETGPCEWKDYKAVSLHNSLCNGYFQNNEALIQWVQQQPLASSLTCIGDGHDGVWNIIARLAPEYQRREVLDWYHLVENLYKVEGSSDWLQQMKTFLWSGCVDEVLEELQKIKTPNSDKFSSYLRKHRGRIVPYDIFQWKGISIGSGAVESTVKQIGARLKLPGAQWSSEYVSKMIHLRCSYLNGAFSLGISTG